MYADYLIGHCLYYLFFIADQNFQLSAIGYLINKWTFCLLLYRLQYVKLKTGSLYRAPGPPLAPPLS